MKVVIAIVLLAVVCRAEEDEDPKSYEDTVLRPPGYPQHIHASLPLSPAYAGSRRVYQRPIAEGTKGGRKTIGVKTLHPVKTPVKTLVKTKTPTVVEQKPLVINHGTRKGYTPQHTAQEPIYQRPHYQSQEQYGAQQYYYPSYGYYPYYQVPVAASEPKVLATEEPCDDDHVQRPRKGPKVSQQPEVEQVQVYEQQEQQQQYYYPQQYYY